MKRKLYNLFIILMLSHCEKENWEFMFTYIMKKCVASTEIGEIVSLG